MGAIRVAQVLKWQSDVRQGQANEVREAVVRVNKLDSKETETLIAFVKELDSRNTFVECICAVLGRRLKLPIPEPLLVLDDNNWFFASVKAQDDNGRMNRFVTHFNQSLVEDLRNFPPSASCVSFDELIFNEDRHSKNILLIGPRKFAFIDHDGCLPGNIDANCPGDFNRIYEIIKDDTNEVKSFKIKKLIKKRINSIFDNLSMNSFLSSVIYSSLPVSYPESQIPSDIFGFLESRKNFLSELVHQRLDGRESHFGLGLSS